VLGRTEGQAYVHYLNQDKRMDEYVPEHLVRIADAAHQGTHALTHPAALGPLADAADGDEIAHGLLAVDEEAAAFGEGVVPMTEEEYDILHHKQIGARRNFDRVFFRRWEIRTWYWSPYPFTEAEEEKLFPTAPPDGPDAAPGALRKGVTSHSRTSDLLAGSLARGGVGMERGSLWVCDNCFKYMMDAVSLEVHLVRRRGDPCDEVAR
jgi:hypothetical protein